MLRVKAVARTPRRRTGGKRSELANKVSKTHCRADLHRFRQCHQRARRLIRTRLYRSVAGPKAYKHPRRGLIRQQFPDPDPQAQIRLTHREGGSRTRRLFTWFSRIRLSQRCGKHRLRGSINAERRYECESLTSETCSRTTHSPFGPKGAHRLRCNWS